jgi:hypothetical protein
LDGVAVVGAGVGVGFEFPAVGSGLSSAVGAGSGVGRFVRPQPLAARTTAAVPSSRAVITLTARR